MATTELVTLEQVEDVLLHGGDLAVVNEDALQEDMIRRILAAETVEDAFGNFKSTPVKQIEGQLLEVTGIAWMRSTFADGPKVYALLKCVIVDTGEEVTASMGGRTTMASFLWAQRNEAMPLRGSFKYERSNSGADKQYLTFILAPAYVK